jgi:hypothetical protein
MRMRRPALGLEPVGEDGGQVGRGHAGLGRAGVAARLGGMGPQEPRPGCPMMGHFLG